ncbi:MAG: DUF4330 domain-containing protein [Defluviitaleaceae bacterium]|nr:DUF4330 domain-containing protein [Defluviitaleaceae bacterium]
MKKIIDEKGRLFGKVSVIDIVVLIALIGLGYGVGYRNASPAIQQLLTADKTFYVTLVSEKVRQFSVDAVEIGDVFFKQHERQPLGSVADAYSAGSLDIMTKPDGTAVLAPVEGRYDLYIVIEATGSVTESGFFVNGNMLVSEGSEFTVLSNRIMLTVATVHEVSEQLPER